MVTKKLNSICPSKLMIQWCSSLGYLRYNSNFWWTSYYGHSRPWYKMLNCSSWLTYGAWCNLNNLHLAGMYSSAYCCINLCATWFCSWTSIPSRIFWQLVCTDRYLVNLCITWVLAKKLTTRWCKCLCCRNWRSPLRFAGTVYSSAVTIDHSFILVLCPACCPLFACPIWFSRAFTFCR